MCNIEGKLEHLSCMIGSTPLLEVSFLYRGRQRVLFVKAEHYNLTGSIKDRMALHILKRAYETGNTGIAFSAIGRALGHPVTIFMPDWLSLKRINLMRSFGADVELVSKEQGSFLASIDMAEALAKSLDSSFLPRQFSNKHNVEAHTITTGPEIWQQLRNQDKTPNAFVAGVGTGGTIMGFRNYLKEQDGSI